MITSGWSSLAFAITSFPSQAWPSDPQRPGSSTMISVRMLRISALSSQISTPIRRGPIWLCVRCSCSGDRVAQDVVEAAAAGEKLLDRLADDRLGLLDRSAGRRERPLDLPELKTERRAS